MSSAGCVDVKTADAMRAGIYVHIPFCRSKCGYCDFHSVARIDLADDYLTALQGEIAERIDRGWTYPTVYIGGGTPSVLGRDRLSRLFKILPLDNVEEFTIEVNPEDVTAEFAEFLGSSPVNRVSMGVQSLIDSELQTARRRHTSAKAVEAFNLLRSAGINNISLDLIYGLPGQTLDTWNRSLGLLLELKPEHLSAYMLSYEPKTLFSAMRASGKIRETDDDTLVEMYRSLIDRTRIAGMEHYEISNFAKPGFRSRHNSGYWNNELYIGLGTGAHSLTQESRGFNPADIRRYIECGGKGFFCKEEESVDNRFNDMVITRLRTAEGTDLRRVKAEFGAAFADSLIKSAAPHISSGDLIYDGTSLRFSEAAWLVSDAVMVDLIRI